MQNFVKDRSRGTSPQNVHNGMPGVNAKRLASAANAKVSLKKGSLAQQSQAHLNIPSRGFGNIQNSSAVVQQHPQHGQPGQGQSHKHDPYDTDAESLDTTVNLSVVQVEDGQAREGQHQQHDTMVGLDEEPDRKGKGSDEEEDYDDEFTPDEIQLLENERLQDISREEQIAFLDEVRSHGFRTVEGDSYPSTTDGNPTEWEGGQELPSEDHKDDGPPSPSPQRQNVNAQLIHSFAPQIIHRAPLPNRFGTNKAMPKASSLFTQSASLRGQQRLSTQITRPEELVYQNTVTAPPACQPPTYSQPSRNTASTLPISSKNRQSTQAQIGRTLQHFQQQPSGPVRVHLQPPQPCEAAAPPKRLSAARAKVEPFVQQHPEDQEPIRELDATLDGDYDYKTLLGMSYDQLKQEDFDTNPRAASQVLTEDILQKPLVERLEFVQRNLDAEKQSTFFTLLSTTEWEDAGDWFLDQFQSIIERTRNARRSKRKLAREFEHEIERRHRHVSKKQHQVEGAMNEMKRQGEGLVAKSPRISKSPRPKRG